MFRTPVKYRSVFLLKAVLLFFIFSFPEFTWGDFWKVSKAENSRQECLDKVWESPLVGFTYPDYSAAVEILLLDFEEKTGRPLIPGKKQRVGLKVSTISGPGLSTPTNLVRAVILALTRRGYNRNQLFILDYSKSNLRESGFLPPISLRDKGNFFDDVPVLHLDDGAYYDPVWYYDSALPPRRLMTLDALYEYEQYEALPATDFERKSFLPTPLLTDVDFWINLPMYADHPTLQMTGGLVNATLRNMSNHDRFMHSSRGGPVAIAEIAAIPELISSWALTIVSLEKYQYMGGPQYRALYTGSETMLLGSANPVILDFIMLRKMNKLRKEEEFSLIPESMAVFDYAEKLGLGTSDPAEIEIIRLD